MLSLYPDRCASRLSRGAVARGALLSALALGAFSAHAAEVYVQPTAELRGEVNSNHNLVNSGSKSSSAGYSANVGATWGIATPRSDTTIKPEVSYLDYPKDSESSVQGSMNLLSTYHSPRSDFSLYGGLDRRATYSSELASAAFNPLNPNATTTPETGRITTGTTRTLANVTPSYQYSMTQRASIGVSGVYENTTYSGAGAANYVDYDYALANVYLGWDINARSQLTFGVFGTRDTAKSGGAVTNGTGVNLAANFTWTKRYTGRLALSAERDDIDLGLPNILKTRANNVGATYSTAWSGEVSELRLSAGRTFTPSGSGGIYGADQVQIEYGRKLSPRLTADYAARYIRYTTIGSQIATSDYTYSTATAGLKWLASRTWYVAGGLEYFRVNNGNLTGSADNAMVYASFGYQGLGRRP